MKHPDILKQLTLEQKVALLSGKDVWSTYAFPQAGVPSMVMSDGPHGLRRQLGRGDHLGQRPSQPATCFPTAACLAGSGVGTDRFSVLAWGAAAFGVCGELAEERCRETGGGTGSFRMYLMDAMSFLTDSQAARRARIRELDLIGAGKRG